MKELRVVFMGTPQFSVTVLDKLKELTNVVLVVTKPDVETGRKKELVSSPVKVYALENNMQVFTPIKIRKDYQKIVDLKPDIIITAAYGQIIPKELIELPRLGCINIHASLLPKYRGGSPIHTAIINGEKTTGITIMYMNEFMDEGDIIAQEEIQINDNDTMGSMFLKLANVGTDLLLKTLPEIINGTNKRIKQNNEYATYAYNIKREQERIDFNKNGIEIINLIRGLSPMPYANFILDNNEIKVIEANFNKDNSNQDNGTIVIIDKNNLGIKCNDGIIYLLKIKPSGKKEMLIKDYLNGLNKEKYLGVKVNG